MNHSTLSPLEKLERFLEPDLEEISMMSVEEIRTELREAGIETESFVQSVKNMVQERLAKWEQEDCKTDGEKE